jgi:hypothetical protein
LSQSKIRKKLGLPLRTQKPAFTPVPKDRQNYEVIVCAIVNGELKIAREAEDIDVEKFCEGASYQNTFRVYEDGFITPTYSIEPKNLKDEAARVSAQQFDSNTRKFQKLLITKFDEMHPETAERAREFVDIFTEKVNVLRDEMNVVADMSDGAQFDEKCLVKVLEGIEAEYLSTGSCHSMIGWGLRPDVVAMFEIGLQEWKHRHARAISEVAKNVGAKYLMVVNEAWVRDPNTGKRTGQDALTASIISPDGTVLYCAGGIYMRKRQKIQVVRPIEAEADHRTEQRLFPAWVTVN